jgi:hypothetical protein
MPVFTPTADDVDLFKRALFLGDLDPPPFTFGMTREDPANWLHMEIEVLPCSLPYAQAALKVRPKQLYGVNRDTVASVLLASGVTQAIARSASKCSTPFDQTISAMPHFPHWPRLSTARQASGSEDLPSQDRRASVASTRRRIWPVLSRSRCADQRA